MQAENLSPLEVGGGRGREVNAWQEEFHEGYKSLAWGGGRRMGAAAEPSASPERALTKDFLLRKRSKRTTGVCTGQRHV